MNIIKLNNITKTYGNNTVLNRFSMEVETGDFIAITGPSGCGKSTLLNIIGMIESFDSGTYEIYDAVNPKVDSEECIQILRNKISYLFQNFALVNEKTVAYNLEIALHFVKASKCQKKELMKNALNKVGLDGFENKKVFQLSGGEQQRVALARIMLKPSELILADEPTGSLDMGNRDNIMTILTQLNKEGKTIIIVTHDPSIVECAKKVIYLEKQ